MLAPPRLLLLIHDRHYSLKLHPPAQILLRWHYSLEYVHHQLCRLQRLTRPLLPL